MRRIQKRFIVALAVLVLFQALRGGQDSESFLERFNRNLLDSFIGQMRANGKEITPRIRAMFMGYILNRQTQYNEDYEMDELRMKSLIKEVREFLEALDTGEDTWPIVEAGLRGEFEDEVESMLGGSPYVEPIFPSLQDTADKWRELDYSPDRYSRYPGSGAILEIALTSLRLLRERRYQDVKGLLAGQAAERYSNFLSWMLNNTEPLEEYNEYFGNLEWKVGEVGMSDTIPPLVRVLLEMPDKDGDWQEAPFILILDNGNWKIVRFFD